MTIAITLKVNDGIVLAADSATTLSGEDPETGKVAAINVYNSANKVFNLYKGLPIGLITWGLGNIGTASISTLVKDLRRLFTDEGSDWTLRQDDYTIEAVAGQVRRFMYEERYAKAFAGVEEPPLLGFIVAGYSSDGTPGEYELSLWKDCPPPTLLRPPDETGVSWRGMPEALARLILGYSLGLPDVLRENLGVPPENVEPAMEVIKSRLQWPLVQPAMPIQDAIDLAIFFVEVTGVSSRFLPGFSVVGGPTEAAAITKHEQFKWVRRKYYYTSELNPEVRP